jgi:hypothetical protein
MREGERKQENVEDRGTRIYKGEGKEEKEEKEEGET